MEEDIVEKIKGERDILTRMQLIRNNLANLSKDKVIECFESFDFLTFFRNGDQFADAFGDMLDEISDEYIAAINNVARRDGINLLNENKNENITLTSGENAFIIQVLMGSLPGIAGLLRTGIDRKEIIESDEFNPDDAEIETLSEEDRSLIMENFYLYFSNETIERFFPEKMDEIDEERKITIDKKMAEVSENKTQEEKNLYYIFNNMQDLDKLDVITQYSDKLDWSVMSKTIKNEEVRLKIIRIGLEKLESREIRLIASEIETDENRLEVIKLGLEKLSSEDISKIASGIKTAENKIEVIKLGLEKLDSSGISRIISQIKTDGNKLEAINLALEKLSSEDIIKIASGIKTDEDKVEVIKLGLEKLDSKDISKIVSGIKIDVNKLEAINLCLKKLEAEEIRTIILEIETDVNKLEAIKLGLEKLSSEDISKIASEIKTDENKVEVIKLGLEKLDSSGISSIISEIKTDENKLEAIKIGIDKLDLQFMRTIISGIKTEKGKQKIIEIEGIEKILEPFDIVLISQSSEGKKKFFIEEIVKKFRLRGNHIAQMVGVEDNEFILKIDEILKAGTYDSDKIIRLAEIIDNLKDSNSGKLSKIAVEIGMDVFELPLEEQENVIKRVKEIYLTKNLPEVAKDFLIFEQMHPGFFGESKSSGYNDRSRGDIPSLNEMNPSQRRRAIFSDLLRCAMESNSRDLREYIAIIENGDRYFTDVKEGRLKIDKDLPEEKEEILRRYAEILNALYNQTSKGKRADKQRENKEDLEQDLIEIETLFKEDSKVHIPLPDRIVRTFGYWAGIRTFEQSKQMLQDITKSANERNIANAKSGRILLKKGDFVKGVGNSRYFPSMLQKGIVAKDYLGQSADHDFTPLDMDVELIVEEGPDFLSTYQKLKTAPGYAGSNTEGRGLGSIILVFENDGSYVKTRAGHEIDKYAVDKIIQDENYAQKEFFDNNGAGGENAYGIRTGVGSTNIKCIIANEYVDKLGLEIAINGFYIPIVDKSGQVIFTPDMYKSIRDKMQGISYYGIHEFELDETARNVSLGELSQFIDGNIVDANRKREALLKVLEQAIQESGLEMLTEREKDMLPGVVEVIDTGSTGRGTNLPGDGDFDFMVRLDNNVLKNSGEFKDKVAAALSSVAPPQKNDITDKGDFRYKGVKVEGLDEMIDVDLTFTRRTDEIEFTTEECIKDRLETIKRNSLEDYQYVIANILLAKKFLKSAGAYKKKNAAEPEPGEPDTRGGFGAVGIENWVLQNGGSFEKAARTFLETAKECESLSEFQQKYTVWDFGENYNAKENYPHDNFVYNMNDIGFERMKKSLGEYIKQLDAKKEKTGIAKLVSEDREAFDDTLYMRSVGELLERARRLGREYDDKDVGR